MATEKIQIEVDIESGDIDKVISSIKALERTAESLEKQFKDSGRAIPESFNKTTEAIRRLGADLRNIKTIGGNVREGLKTIDTASRFKDLSSQVAQADNAFKQLDQSVLELKKSLVDLKGQRLGIVDKDELNTVNKQINDIESSINRLQGKRLGKGEFITLEQERRDPLTASKLQSFSADDLANEASLKKATTERLNAIKELSRTQQFSYKEALKAEQAVLRTSLEYASSKKEAVYYGQQLTKVSDHLRVLTGDMRSNWERAGTVIKNTALAMTAFQAIRSLSSAFQAGVNTALELENFNVTLGTLLGNTVQAKQKIAELYDFVAKTPLKMPEVQAATQTLLSFGVESNNIIPVLTKLGDLARGEEETFKGLALIYGQARATGRIMTQDLNQFANRGVPLIEEFSKMFNKSGEEIRKMAEAGQLTFPKLDEALNRLTGAGGKFENMMLKASQTTAGRLSTLQDNFNLTVGKLVTLLLPLANAFISFASSALEAMLSFNVGVAKMMVLIEQLWRPTVALGLAIAALNLELIATNVSNLASIALTKAKIPLLALEVASTRALATAKLFLNTVYKTVTTSIIAFTFATGGGNLSIKEMISSSKGLAVALGRMLGVIGLIGTAVWLLVDAFKSATGEKVKFAEVSAQVLDIYKEEMTEANKLFAVLMDVNATYDEKSKALQVINSLYSTYLPFLINEASSLKDVALAQKEVNDQLQANAAIKLRNQLFEEYDKKAMEIRIKRADELRSQGKSENEIIDENNRLFAVQQLERLKIQEKVAVGEKRIAETKQKQYEDLDRQRVAQADKFESEANKKILDKQKILNQEKTKLQKELTAATTKEEKDRVNKELSLLKKGEESIPKEQKAVQEIVSDIRSGKVIKERIQSFKEESKARVDLNKQIQESQKLYKDEAEIALIGEEASVSLGKASESYSFFEKAAAKVTKVVAEGVQIFGDTDLINEAVYQTTALAEATDKTVAATIAVQPTLARNTEEQKKNTSAVVAGTGAKANYIKTLQLEVKELKAALKPMQDYTHQLTKATEALNESIRRRREGRNTPLELEELPLLQKNIEQSLEARKRYNEAIEKLDEDRIKEQEKLSEAIQKAEEEIEDARKSGDMADVARLQDRYKNILDKRSLEQGGYIANLLLKIRKSYAEQVLEIERTNNAQVEAVRLNHYSNMIDMLEDFQKKELELVKQAQLEIATARLNAESQFMSSLEFQTPETRSIATETKFQAELLVNDAEITKRTNAVTDANRKYEESNKALAESLENLRKVEDKIDFRKSVISSESLAELTKAQQDYEVAVKTQQASELQLRRNNLLLLQEEAKRLRLIADLERQRRQNQLDSLKTQQERESNLLNQQNRTRQAEETSMFGIFDVNLRRYSETDQGKEHALRKKQLKDEIDLNLEQHQELERKQQEHQDRINELLQQQSEAQLKGETTKSAELAKLIKEEESLQRQTIEEQNQREEQASQASRNLGEEDANDERDRNLLRRQRFLEVVSFLENASQQVLGFFNSVYQAQLALTDKLIDAQKAKVEKARDIALKSQEKGAAEQLQLEEERLDKYQKMRESYIEDQKNLATIELAINTAIAVSRAVAEGGGIASVATVALAIGALIAGLATARSIANSQTFSQGGFTGNKEDKRLTAFGGKDSVGIVHKNEYVFDEATTAKYRPYLEQVHQGSLNLLEELQWAQEGRKAKKLSSLKASKSLPQVVKDSSLSASELKKFKSLIAVNGQTVPQMNIMTMKDVDLLNEVKSLRKDVSEVAKAVREMPSTDLTLDDQGLTARMRQITYNNQKLESRNR